MQSKRVLILVGLAFLACTMQVFANSGQANRQKDRAFAFAIVADGPYGEDQEALYDRLIDDVNSDRDIKFVIHAGDIKSGGERCDDDLLIRRFEQFQQFRRAFVYTPGDNEWTDCHRTSNGNYLPTERLDFVRDLFFPHANRTTGGKPMRVRTQAGIAGYEKFVENTLFNKNGVLFSQIHVVGSNNNLRPWDQIDPSDSFATPRDDRLAEFEERNEASIDWLKRTFRVAKRRKAPAVFITIHANPRFDVNNAEEDRAGFNAFLDALLDLVDEYGKPVVLAHGDFHVFLIDIPRLVPFYANEDAEDEDQNRKVSNLTRVQTFGDTENHWIKVEVDPDDKNVFRFLPQIVDSNL